MLARLYFVCTSYVGLLVAPYNCLDAAARVCSPNAPLLVPDWPAVRVTCIWGKKRSKGQNEERTTDCAVS